MSVHLHHVHLKSADPTRSMDFYEKFLAAQRIKLNDVTDALRATPILLLIDQSQMAPISKLPTALQHVGWGSTDPGTWYEAAHKQGVAPDTRGNTLFNTKDTPTIGDPGSGGLSALLLGSDTPPCLPAIDRFSYMYVLGPDQERIEVWSGADKRVNHVHFTTPDVAAVTRWYTSFLGLSKRAQSGLTYFAFYLDEIVFFFEAIGQRTDYEKTDDHVLSHIAFSVSDLDTWLERARAQNIEVVAEPVSVHGWRSFFVRGPDGTLVELVQAAPSRQLCLNDAPTLPPAP